MVDFVRSLFGWWWSPVEWTPGTIFIYEFRCVESPFPKETWFHQCCTVARTAKE